MKFLKGAAGIAAIATAIASAPAMAVNVSKDGVGEVAISPFYSTRNNWSSLINLTNTSDKPIVVKVRLHESYNSRDVLDFIVALSSYDVWTGRVFEGPNGPVLRSLDQTNDAGDITCTIPSTVGYNIDTKGTAGTADDEPYALNDGTPLSTLGFGVNPASATATDIDRLREGYVEFLVMGHSYGDDPVDHPVGFAIENHDCDTLDVAFDDRPMNGTTFGPVFGADGIGGDEYDVRNTYILATAQEFGEPINAVKFNARMLNGTLGVEAGLPVTTWANFFNPGGVDAAGAYDGAGGAVIAPLDGVVTPDDNFDCLVTRGDERIQSDGFYTGLDWEAGVDPTDSSCQNLIAAQRDFAFLEPSLGDAYPPLAYFWNDQLDIPVEFLPIAYGSDDGLPAVFGSQRGIDAVSATIMRESILNEWSTNPAQGVATEWVVTFPTKGFYVDYSATDEQAALIDLDSNAEGVVALRREEMDNGGEPYAPFENEWDGTQSCDEYSFTLYDRAEQSLDLGGVIISPTPSGVRPSLCFESNVITFNGITRLGSPMATVANRSNIDTSGLTNNAGWMDLTFDTPALTPTLAGEVTDGTPPIIGMIGKPVIGFILKVRTFPNSAADQNFASAVEHGYRTKYRYVAPVALPVPAYPVAFPTP